MQAFADSISFSTDYFATIPVRERDIILVNLNDSQRKTLDSIENADNATIVKSHLGSLQ